MMAAPHAEAVGELARGLPRGESDITAIDGDDPVARVTDKRVRGCWRGDASRVLMPPVFGVIGGLRQGCLGAAHSTHES
jgi:hypothetical protein